MDYIRLDGNDPNSTPVFFRLVCQLSNIGGIFVYIKKGGTFSCWCIHAKNCPGFEIARAKSKSEGCRGAVERGEGPEVGGEEGDIGSNDGAEGEEGQVLSVVDGMELDPDEEDLMGVGGNW